MEINKIVSDCVFAAADKTAYTYDHLTVSYKLLYNNFIEESNILK
jgi:hypothetical protein